MTEPNIYGIFSTPIYFSNINRKFNSKELLFIENNKSKVDKNEGNTNSKENYILNKKEFKNLKKELDLIVQDYFNKVICTENKICPYITQSWLNYTETNQYHHKHAHPNSLLSAVLYINADEKFDKINFYRDEYMPFKFDIKKWNNFNSTSWWFPVKTGDVVIFPSSLIHSVDIKKGKNTRTSLAFNVFIKGNIGKSSDLTELNL
jgi:uncharacterized protein (TIGR02466 family)